LWIVRVISFEVVSEIQNIGDRGREDCDALGSIQAGHLRAAVIVRIAGQRRASPHHIVKSRDSALNPVGHRGRGAHLVSLDHFQQATEPISQIGNFATVQMALRHTTIVPDREPVRVEATSTIIVIVIVIVIFIVIVATAVDPRQWWRPRRSNKCGVVEKHKATTTDA
jgi:hypothetical protein